MDLDHRNSLLRGSRYRACNTYRGGQLTQRARVRCRKSVRTSILHDYSWIMVANHPGGDQLGGRRGESDRCNVYLKRWERMYTLAFARASHGRTLGEL